VPAERARDAEGVGDFVSFIRLLGRTRPSRARHDNSSRSTSRAAEAAAKAPQVFPSPRTRVAKGNNGDGHDCEYRGHIQVTRMAACQDLDAVDVPTSIDAALEVCLDVGSAVSDHVRRHIVPVSRV